MIFERGYFLVEGFDWGWEGWRYRRGVGVVRVGGVAL